MGEDEAVFFSCSCGDGCRAGVRRSVAREEAAEEINDGSCVGEEHIKPRHPKSCCSIQLYIHVKTRITAVPGISPRTVMRVIFYI